LEESYGKEPKHTDGIPAIFFIGMVLGVAECSPALTLKGVFKKWRKNRHANVRWLVWKGNENKFARMPQLSGGQLQRVPCTMPGANPNILFLDDPMAHWMVFTRAKMQFFLLEVFQKRELSDLNPTIVLVTHDPREAYYWAMIYIYGFDPGHIINISSRISPSS